MKNNSFIFNEESKIKYIAHRGMQSIAPQNSIPAFTYAGRAGAWAIETDVHKTKDGHLMCCHNDTIDSTFDGIGEISQMTKQELMFFKLNKGNCIECYSDNVLRMPTFEEYIDICIKYGAIPFIELKSNTADEVISLLKKKDICKRSVISSLNWEHINATREITKDVFIHHIFSEEKKIPKLADMGNSGMSFNYKNIDEAPRELIDKAHSAGVLACFRACDTPETYFKAKKLGVDYFPTNKIGDMCALDNYIKGAENE